MPYAIISIWGGGGQFVFIALAKQDSNASDLALWPEIKIYYRFIFNGGTFYRLEHRQ